MTCPHCGQAGKITSTNYLNEARTVADLYSQCSDSKGCGARFVYSLGIMHTI
ncbi:MAG: ogr/Delta-like zinc finger family protein, partial [Methylomicrobium sp.]|nr:ogr/Delta-like zinc finger family protein [Methylomicrobium sp.]